MADQNRRGSEEHWFQVLTSHSKRGDVLTIHQISGGGMTLEASCNPPVPGEITYPGPYGIQEGERLSSVLKRAGGFRVTAYPAGAVLIRNQVKELEDKSRNELIHQIETTSAGAKLCAQISLRKNDTATLQLLIQQQKSIVELSSSQPKNRATCHQD